MRKNAMDKKILVWVGMALALIGVILGGCGYRLAGTGTLPDGVVRVFVAEPVNRTAESRLISIISNELKNEMTRRQVRMVDASQDADGVLKSEIVSLSDAIVARRGETMALEKRITLRMDLILEKQDGQVLWRGKNIEADESYAVISGDDIATGSNRQEAIYELSKRLAEDVYNRLTADF